MYHPDRQYVGPSAEQKVGLQSDKGVVTHQQNGNCDLEFPTLQRAYEHLQFENGIGSQSNPAHSLNLMLDLNSTSDASALQTTNHDSDDPFKARLVVILLEYGDKGLALCNIKKKWPGTPFPPDLCTEKTKQKGFLANYIVQHAGDVVVVGVLELQYPSDQTGNARVVPYVVHKKWFRKRHRGHHPSACRHMYFVIFLAEMDSIFALVTQNGSDPHNMFIRNIVFALI
eukprot:scaffold97840_cov57-Attheya_sp.AAC.3